MNVINPYVSGSNEGDIPALQGSWYTGKALATTSSTGGGQGHSHSITLTNTSGTTGTKGKDTSFSTSTMQPYIVVYMYKRTV